MFQRALLGLVASILLLSSSCKDPNDQAGGTSGAALYAFDSTANAVYIWSDVSTLYDATSTVSPSHTLTSSLLSKVSSLAWGGLCFDRDKGLLYLVSDTGTIVRIGNVRAQNGSIASADIVSFSLASTGRLTNGKFGQAALDVSTNTLYITESGDSATQVWVVSGASVLGQDATVSLQALSLSSDSGGTGVAAYGGSVYAYMQDGGTVGIDALTGPRLRRGSATAFDPNAVILGSKTLLGKYGALALDSGNGYLYVARHNTDAGATTAPILVFTTGQFGSAYNQAPTQQIGSPTAQASLRVLTHPGTKDWLAGLPGTAGNTIYLWKSPLGGSAAKSITAPAGAAIKGIAIDGNAS